MKLLDNQIFPNPSFSWIRKVETCDGVALRAVYWPSLRGADNQGTVCLLQGRAECIEKYFETIKDLLQRDFAVLAFDWRGQGGSERLLNDPGKGHVDDFVEYQYDLLAISRRLLPLTPKPHFCLAHGMGGAIALEAAIRNVSPFDRQVLVSPMIELSQQVLPKLTSAATWVGNTLGYGEEYITGNDAYFNVHSEFTGNHFTSDEKRFEAAVTAYKAMGDKMVGSPTVSWMQAAFRQMARFAQGDFARKMTVPTVAITGGSNTVCVAATTARLLAPVKVAQTLSVRGARHDLLMERDTYRRELWAAFDVFVPGETIVKAQSERAKVA